jgi:hypothetical protein
MKGALKAPYSSFWTCACTFLVMTVGALHVQAQQAEKKFETLAVVRAHADYVAATHGARQQFSQALASALKSAMTGGDLTEANAINSVKTALNAGTEPPRTAFKGASAVQARSAYDATVAKARTQYVAVLQATQKTVLASGNLVEANAIQAELTAVTGSAATTSGKLPPNESDDLVISGSGFTIATLEENEPAFSNRGYVWQKVPKSIRGARYTKTSGGKKAEIKVQAKRNTVVNVIMDLDDPGVKLTGWDKTGTDFTYNNGKDAKIVLFRKQVRAGEELSIPQGNWGGVLVLLPPAE